MRVNRIVLNLGLNNFYGIENQKISQDYSNIKYAQVPRMGLVSFGFKGSAVADLLKGAKDACLTNKAIDLLKWERETACPGTERISEITSSLSDLSTLLQAKTRAPIIKNSLSALQNTVEPLTSFEKALVRIWGKSLKEAENVPDEFVERYDNLLIYSNEAWAKAREKSDFKIFEPYLTKVFIAEKKRVQYIDPQRKPLDVLLEDTGYTTEQIDKIMVDLKERLVPLVKQISAMPRSNQEVLSRHVNMEQFREVLHNIAQDMGLDMSKVKLGNTEHSVMYDFDSPYEIGIAISNPIKNGSRATIADCIDVLTSITHEGGHGLVELGASPKLNQTKLTGADASIHESQARLWENNVGRSREFLSHYFPIFQKKVEGFENIRFDDFYNAVNAVQPSPIRTMADEVTYNLHIMIRYELEKDILHPKNTDEDIRKRVSELPQKWNQKYEEYLGIRPKNDAEGVLQDGHWADGLIGYFPAYALANIASAQFMRAAQKEIPDLNKKIATGDFKTLGNWLREKIYQHGQIYTPDEVLQRVTGESLNPQYFIEYLQSRYL